MMTPNPGVAMLVLRDPGSIRLSYEPTGSVSRHGKNRFNRASARRFDFALYFSGISALL
jgi:hypothetical protein